MKERGIASKAAIILAFAVVGWAYCGALIGVGRQFFTMDTTLVIHAIGAPVGFAVLSWIYHRNFAFTRPMYTALIFLAVVIALDIFPVAIVFEKSFAMFRSVIGTWLPWALIVVSTWAVGLVTTRRAGSGSVGAN
jgi:hypothetical protein